MDIEDTEISGQDFQELVQICSVLGFPIVEENGKTIIRMSRNPSPETD